MRSETKRRVYGRRVGGVTPWESQHSLIAKYGSTLTQQQVARRRPVLSVRLNRPLDVKDIEDVGGLVRGWFLHAVAERAV